MTLPATPPRSRRAATRRPRESADGVAVVHALIAHASDAIIVQDLDSGRIVDANERAEALYGYSRAELLAFPSGWDPRAEQQPEPGDSLFELAARGSDVPASPRWHRRKDGTVIPVEASVSRVGLGARTLLIATLRDVSARLAAEEERDTRLAEVEGLLELAALLGDANDMQTALDRIVEGAVRCARASGGWLALPEGDSLLLHRALRRGVWHQLEQPLRVDHSVTGTIFRTGQVAVIDDLSRDPRVDPSLAALGNARAMLAVPVRGRNGSVLAVLSILERLDGRRFESRDITLLEAAALHAGVALARIQAQAGLAAREAHFRALMEQAQDAVFVIEPETYHVIDANPRAEALVGRTLAQMRARGRLDPRPPDERDLGPGAVSLLVEGKPVRGLRRVWQHADGRRIPVELSAGFIDSPYGRVIRLTARDISDQVAAEDERQRLHAEITRNAWELGLLLDATAALNAAQTEEEVVRAVAERAAALCSAESGSVCVPREGGLALVAQEPDGGWRMYDYTLPEGGCIVARVLESGRTYRSDDLSTDPYTDHDFDAAKGLRTQLSVPALNSERRVLAVVSVSNKVTGEPFNTHDEALLVNLATQAAVALERAHSRVELARTVDALRASEERYRDLFENANDIVYVSDLAGNLLTINRAGERASGYTREELLTKNLADLLTPQSFELGRQMLMRNLYSGEGYAYQVQAVAKDGSVHDLEVSSRLVVHDGHVTGVQGIARDVTERVRFQEQLTRQAYYDPLTGLPNRTLFMDRLAAARTRAEATRRSIGLLFLDLDGFKVVNDSLGHIVGDDLLVAVGQRIAACLRGGDTVARFGGDEFAVLAEEIARPEEAVRLAERIIERLSAPFTVAGQEMFVSASAGIAYCTCDDDEAHAGDLLREADIAMYQAKQDGKARAVVFDSSMHARVRKRLELETDLRRALERGELRLHYQPEIDLQSGRIVGAEALLRWEHPRYGLLPPATFVPLAEETGLILAMGEWALREACRQAGAWKRAYGHTPLLLSVNLSARQFQQQGLLEQVMSALDGHGLAPADLRLEITESVVMADIRTAGETMRQLDALGVCLAIDDFGKGYSALGYLRRFPMRALKIDRSFIDALTGDENSLAIIRAIVTLGHALGMRVTAEGIEDREQLERVCAAGCDLGQGFLFARPLPPEGMAALLAAAQHFPLTRVA